MKINQIGRSMIEMLGVLAVIGVLSVGGIAGFSKAMLQYKLNQQASQLNSIVQSIVQQHGTFSPIATRTNVTKMLIAIGAIPKEMIIPNDNLYIRDNFGNTIYFVHYNHKHDYWDMPRIDLYLQIKSGKDDEILMCRNFYMVAQQLHAHIISMDIEISDTYVPHYGDSYGTCAESGQNCLRDLSPSIISKACERVKEFSGISTLNFIIPMQ